MTQLRTFEFGQNTHAGHLRALVGKLGQFKVLDGFDVAVVSGPDGTLSVSPGSAVMDDGVLVQEDSTKELSITLGSVAKNYTIYYEHILDQIKGGNAAVLTITDSLVFSDVVDDDKTPLAWVVYPGGSVPLEETHIINTVKMSQASALLRTCPPPYVPPFVSNPVDTANVSAYSGLYNNCVCTILSLGSGAGAASAEVLALPVWFEGNGKPRKVRFYAKSVSATDCVPRVYDLVGTLVTSTWYAGASDADGFKLYEVTLSPVGADWLSSGYFMVRASTVLQPGGLLYIKNLVVKLMGDSE